VQAFVYAAQPSRIVFGAGALSHLEREIELLGARRALVLSTPGQSAQAESVADRLGARAAGVFARAAMHVPIESARQAREVARRIGADCAVAIGGGSTTGLGKAIALDSGLPILAIPTTYAGSEVTPIYGFTEAGLKKTGRDPRVLPRTVIYDPGLTVALPVPLSVTSAINAIAHAVEGLYAHDANPVTNLMAEEGIRALAQAIPRLCEHPRDLSVRGDALYGAWLCGSVLGSVAMSLHHKLCHTLGGTFNLPHAPLHAVILPQAVHFNAAAAPDAMDRVARALGTGGGAQVAVALHELARRHGAPVSLRELGMKATDLDRATDLAVADPYPNPRPIGPAQRDAVRQLLRQAYDGERPA
jgi:maleylacetate reductase